MDSSKLENSISSRKPPSTGFLGFFFYLLFLMISLPVTLSKHVSGSLKTWEFENKSCFFLSRFGTESKSGHFDFHHQVNWLNTDDRLDYGDIDGEILILDQEGHSRAQDLLSKFDSRIKEKLQEMQKETSSKQPFLIKEFQVSLFHDGTDSTNFELTSGSSLFYFYFCDLEGKIVSSYKRKMLAHKLEIERIQREKREESGIKEDYEDKKEDNKDKHDNSESPTGPPVIPHPSLGLPPDIFTSGTVLSYKLDIIDGRGYHHSLEEAYTGLICACFIPAYICLLAHISRKVHSYRKETSSLDHPLVNIWAITLLELASLLFQLLKYFLYTFKGYDMYLELPSKLAFLLSDGALATFFILMSKGWGVVSLNLVVKFEGEVALGIALLMGRYIWVLIGYFSSSQSENLYHMYDGWVGVLEMLNLLVFFFWFQCSLNTRSIFMQPKFRSLKTHLLLLGSVYYLIRPLCVLGIAHSPPSLRGVGAYLLTLVSHLGVTGFLGVTLTRRRGVYMKIAISQGGLIIMDDGNTRVG